MGARYVPGAGRATEQCVSGLDAGERLMAYMGFEAVKKSAAAGGARNPGAVAAAIGRKKYTKAKFQKGAALGRKKGHSAAVAYFKGLKGD
jgi:hypothetical protein